MIIIRLKYKGWAPNQQRTLSCQGFVDVKLDGQVGYLQASSL